MPNVVRNKMRSHKAAKPRGIDTELEQYWTSRTILRPLQDFMRDWVVESINLNEHQRLIQSTEQGNERVQ